MGWSTSYISAAALVAGLTGAIDVDLSASNTHLKMALFDNSVTPDPDGLQYYGSGVWASGEVSGTNWPAGGVAVSPSGAGLTAQAGGIMRYTFTAVSVDNTTLGDYYGGIIYDTNLSDLVICAIWGGGDIYSTAGTPAGFTPPAAGVWSLPCIPGA